MDLSVQVPKSKFVKTDKPNYEYKNGFLTNTGPKMKELPVSLEQCFDQFTMEQRLERPCLNCGAEDSIDKKMTLFHLPKVLVVHVKRFEEEQDFTPQTFLGFTFEAEPKKKTTPVTVPTTLDMSPYRSQEHGSKSNYKLFGICQHHDWKLCGHYTAEVQNTDTGQWYDLNDRHIDRIESPELENDKSYLLFYVTE